MRTKFSDAVAFVHQFVLRTTFVRERSRQFDVFWRHLPSGCATERRWNWSERANRIRNDHGGGECIARRPSESRAHASHGGGPGVSAWRMSIRRAPTPPAKPIAVTLAGPVRDAYGKDGGLPALVLTQPGARSPVRLGGAPAG